MKKLTLVLTIVAISVFVSSASATLYIAWEAGEGTDTIADRYIDKGDPVGPPVTPDETYAEWDAAKPLHDEALGAYGHDPTTAYIDLYVKVDGADATWGGGCYDFTVAGGTPADDLSGTDTETTYDYNVFVAFPPPGYFLYAYQDSDSWLAAEYELAFGGYPKVQFPGGNVITLGGGPTLSDPSFPNLGPTEWVHFGRIGLTDVSDLEQVSLAGAVWNANEAADGEVAPSGIELVETPEPATLLLLGIGGVVALIRRK